MYGWAWLLAFACLTAVMNGVYRAGTPDETIGLLWSALSGLVVGTLYLAGGALWQDRVQYGLGTVDSRRQRCRFAGRLSRRLPDDGRVRRGWLPSRGGRLR